MSSDDSAALQARREQRRSYYLRNREAILAARREYRQQNPEKAAEAVRRCWERNGEKYRQREREWARRPDVAERLRARKREYFQRAEVKARVRDRLATPAGRVNSRIRSRMNRLIRFGGEWHKTKTIVGYSIAELMSHLERQFLKDMSWENMGEWHIDHIIPLSQFKVTGPDCPEARRAWALTNLRPLWASDNLRKGPKMETLL